ncbi:hypothetical protein GCM10028783_22540 [Modestobacter muralis]
MIDKATGGHVRVARAARAGQAGAMSAPEPDHDQVNLHPGQYDEGGEGGMATRELAARQQQEDDDAED